MFLRIKLLLLISTLPFSLLAQNSAQFKYQMVLRNTAGEPQVNTSVSVTIDILASGATGTSVFQEIHDVNSDANGLITLDIGTSSDLNAVDWAQGSYWLSVAVDGINLGASQLVSVPYALYAKEAGTVSTFDYNNLTNKPDFTGWDTDVTDDFDGDFNSLTNKPTTITEAQVATVDNITATSAIDLDNTANDVATNNAKVSFPGFGTVPGTALEAGTDIWVQSGSNAFYNAGNVGINVPTDADFGSSNLYVGGGIKYGSYTQASLPPQEAGLLFYVSDYDDDNGGFAVYDNVGLKYLNTTPSVWGSSDGDVFTSQNVIIGGDNVDGGGLGVGSDIVNGEFFGLATIKLKENNIRILFNDSDPEGGSDPYNDWQLTANSSLNGGGSYFAIEDITAGTVPFLISAGAPDDALYLDPSGNIGVGTNAPTARLEVNGTIKAATFVGDGSNLTGITGATGGVSNAGSTTISAGTGQIDFQINGTTEMVVANNGNVGIGTTSPSATLDINGDVNISGGINISGNLALQGQVSYESSSQAESSNTTKEYDVSQDNIIIVDVSTGVTLNVNGFTNGVAGQIITLINKGLGTMTLVHNAAVTTPVLITGSTNVNLTTNQSVTLVSDGTNWFTLSINN